MTVQIIKTATGFKTSPKGRVINASDKAAALFGSMQKGDARKLRKALHADPELRTFAAIPAVRAA